MDHSQDSSSSAEERASLRDPSQLFFQTDTIRRYIIASYWLIIVLAAPLWWSTTSIERLSLPSSTVISQAHYSLEIPVTLSFKANPDNVWQAVQLEKILDDSITQAPARWKGLKIHVDHVNTLDKLDNTAYVIKQGDRTLLSDRELKYSLEDSTPSDIIEIISDLITPFPQRDHRIAQYATHYRLSFTLLNEDSAAGGAINHWAINEAISSHVSPILKQLSALHNFTIESQVQFHAPLAFRPVSLGDAYGLTREDLSVFVNSAEWTLSSSASNDPVLHFVLFVPSSTRQPLYIMGNNGDPLTSNAFLLPQWGGIAILNLPEHDKTLPIELTTSTLDPIFSTFSDQLLALLGAPKLPKGLNKDPHLNNKDLTGWQLDALLRHRSLENARSSQDTLRSIIKLIDQIENMPVGQSVKGDVQEALSAIAKMYISSKKSLPETLRHSANAFALASRAFFNPGMLALLYFPAEHKYAVYTPLFASAVIPLFVAALKEVFAWRRQRNQVASMHSLK